MNTANDLPLVEHHLELPELGKVRMLVISPPGESSIAVLIKGNIEKQERPVVRIHSRCFHGEVFGALDCDCKAQLDLALDKLAKEGAGIFVYMEQEGRGHGLVSKAMAYELLEKRDLDTVDAYLELGLTVDARRYAIVAQILQELGITQIRLITNNPSKISQLEEAGLDVESENLRTAPTSHNYRYLRVKQNKLGHELGIDD